MHTDLKLLHTWEFGYLAKDIHFTCHWECGYKIKLKRPLITYSY